MKNALILLAGGSGKRFSNDPKSTPKQFKKFGNYNLIEFFLKNLDDKIFDIIVIVVKKSSKIKYLRMITKKFDNHNISFANSGSNRQESSKNGLYSLIKKNPKNILIHDSARPLASNKLILRLIKCLNTNQSVAPYVTSNDLLKEKKTNLVIDKNKILNIQTPQAFKFKKILEAHKKFIRKDYKDDTSLIEKIGIKTKLIKGEVLNFKLTYKEDLLLFNNFTNKEFRSGIGYDIHRINLKSKKLLTLCGVKIPYFPLTGHSDADVGYHAICDSIFGALSMRDIGYYFNNNNKKWKNANSKIFVEFCKKKLEENNYKIINLDLTFICEKPKIYKYINKMKKNISSLLYIDTNIISIKATTNEKIGYLGSGKGIAAQSIVQIKND